MMNFLLGNVIDEAREENGETKYFIRGKQLKGNFRTAVLFSGYLLAVCALTTFWFVFLVDVTYSCDPNLDCYPFPAGFSKVITWNIPAIINCSDYEILPDNTTIVCFTFTFDYHEAIGAVGSVFAFMVFGIRAMIGIIVWLQNKHSVEFSKAAGYCLLSLLSAFSFIIITLGWLLATLVPIFRPLLLGPPKSLHFMVYGATFIADFLVIPMMYLQHYLLYKQYIAVDKCNCYSGY